MKKGLISTFAIIACLGLAGCGTTNNKQAEESSEASSLKKDNAKLKSSINKKKQKEKEQNTSSSNSASQKNTNNQQKNQSQQQNSQSNTSHASQQANSINNAQDALNAAKAKYGDGNGNYQWTVMYDADTGQPIRNADGSYFVKAIDPTQGTMTGTAQSVNVYPDGSMTNN